MKDKIIKVMGYMEPNLAAIKATEIIILFNARIIEKMKQDKPLHEIIDDIFIRI